MARAETWNCSTELKGGDITGEAGGGLEGDEHFGTTADSQSGRRYPNVDEGAVELRMRPSIIPANRLDRDMYLVLEDFSSGAAWRETDEDRTDYRTLISDLLTGQYDHPLRVVAFAEEPFADVRG